MNTNDFVNWPWEMLGAIIGVLSFLLTLSLEWNRLQQQGWHRILLPLLVGGLVTFAVVKLPALLTSAPLTGGAPAATIDASLPPPEMIPSPTPALVTAFGPTDGAVAHKPADGLAETYRADVSVQDFLVGAEIANPCAAQECYWDYGFVFRQSAQEGQYVVGVASTGEWYHYYHDAVLGGDITQMQKGNSILVKTADGETNSLLLIVIGKTGWFFVNHQPVGKLDVKDITGPGDVRLVVQYTTEGIAGETTYFSDFTVRPISSEASWPQGQVVLKGSNQVLEEYELAPRIRNFIAEAVFVNPVSATGWDYGFIFRNPKGNYYHLVLVSNSGTWEHILRTGADLQPQTLQSGSDIRAKSVAQDTNHLRLIAWNDYGWLFINDEPVGTIDLSGYAAAGRLNVMGGYHWDHDADGITIEFSNATVWRIAD